MEGFKNKKEQETCIKKIRERGMTISGWARANGFARNNVVNMLYRDIGISNYLGTSGEKIMKKLLEQDLV